VRAIWLVLLAVAVIAVVAWLILAAAHLGARAAHPWCSTASSRCALIIVGAYPTSDPGTPCGAGRTVLPAGETGRKAGRGARRHRNAPL